MAMLYRYCIAMYRCNIYLSQFSMTELVSLTAWQSYFAAIKVTELRWTEQKLYKTCWQSFPYNFSIITPDMGGYMCYHNTQQIATFKIPLLLYRDSSIMIILYLRWFPPPVCRGISIKPNHLTPHGIAKHYNNTRFNMSFLKIYILMICFIC